jgi:N-dimethylarginine dimethylaminohydrolase
MDEQLRIILIIIVSVSIFGLLVFVYVKNYIRNKINQLVEEEKIAKHYKKIIHSDLSTIEKYGGGSARCMLSELF